MTVFDNYFPMGLGTTRFPISGPKDITGIDKSIALVRHALESGINYIDTSYTYSAGMAQTVLKEAFAETKKPFGVTVKVMLDACKTSDDTRRHVELQLRTMGIDKAAFFTCWNINSYRDFLEIVCKGGIYEAALKLKDEGLIDHICFSAHAFPKDIVKIIESGAFEGVTISYSLINAAQMQHVLDTANGHNVGVAVMNPLGGGLIAQNRDFFAFAQATGEDNTITAAMRFAKAHPAVKILLSGVSSLNEFDENIRTFIEPNPEPDAERFARVSKNVKELQDFCTGCNYCAGCPVDIPISEIMKKRNALLFNHKEAYNRIESELVKNIKLFYTHAGQQNAAEWFPDTPSNPCIHCEQCEKKCTQKLKIIDAIADTFDRARKVGFSLEARKTRLTELLAGKKLTRVGLYPNGGFANMIVELYTQLFGKPDFEWVQFNSAPQMWGELSGGLSIHSPEDITPLKPDIIIVCTYKYDSEIYESLRKYEKDGIRVVKLHRDTDVPWIF